MSTFEIPIRDNEVQACISTHRPALSRSPSSQNKLTEHCVWRERNHHSSFKMPFNDFCSSSQDKKKRAICFSDLKLMPHSYKGWTPHWWIQAAALFAERPQRDPPICPCLPPGWREGTSCFWLTAIWVPRIPHLETEISQATTTSPL